MTIMTILSSVCAISLWQLWQNADHVHWPAFESGTHFCSSPQTRDDTERITCERGSQFSQPQETKRKQVAQLLQRNRAHSKNYLEISFQKLSFAMYTLSLYIIEWPSVTLNRHFTFTTKNTQGHRQWRYSIGKYNFLITVSETLPFVYELGAWVAANVFERCHFEYNMYCRWRITSDRNN